jgi:hypothetical protein
MIKNTFIFLLLIVCLNSFSQETIQKKYKSAIGLGAGYTTGMGISYRYFPKNIGVQFNFIPLYQDYGKSYFINLGATLLLNLKENERNSFYFYWGNNLMYGKDMIYKFDPIAALDYYIQYQQNGRNIL